MCPGEETVAAYVAGKLSRADRDALESHLDNCSACLEMIALLGKLRGSRDAATQIVPLSTLGAASTAGDAPADDAFTWAVGERLGRYILLERLGSGGMGAVYAAYDPELDRKVAVKLLRRSGHASRLRDEARAIAQLAHPNVVAVHDVGEVEGEVFVAMEYVGGATVRDWLHASPRTPAEIIEVFLAAGRGLAAAHTVGIVHRDVKPSNLIVGSDGRTRVVDFGLAQMRAGDDDAVVGTPAYMAPEQQRGEPVDARADQYSFCVALWEALAGSRPGASERIAREHGDATPDRGADASPGAPDRVPGVSDRVVRALRRGLAERPADRFATLDELLRELAPPPRRARRWILPAFVAGGLLAAGGILLLAPGSRAQETCAHAGDAAALAWGDAQRTRLADAFAATRLPYAAVAATDAIAAFDAWSASWRAAAADTCRATLVDRVQPPEVHVQRRACLDQLVERFVPLVEQASRTDAAMVARAGGLASLLPDPARCTDPASLVEPPSELVRGEVADVRAAIARSEAAIFAGERPDIDALVRRADVTGYAPLRARARFLDARLAGAASSYDRSVALLHEAARLATAARDQELLAEIWIDLAQTLGNDARTFDQAALFDGYAEALIARLPDRDALALQLEFARCNRNLDHGRADDALALVNHCANAIARAGSAHPPRPAIANSARVRLGHFQRLLGNPAQARATLTAAVDEAVKIHGPQHPDTAVAHYALGVAELSEGDSQIDAGIAQLREALAIRRAAFPGGSLQVAESLQGLADALATKGSHRDAIPLLEEAIALLDRIGQANSPTSANVRVMIGMSLEEVARDEDAIPHYLRAADIADRSLQHAEAIAAMALRLAADASGRHGRAALGVDYLERALRLLERGKAAPYDVGKTQQRMAELLVLRGDKPRARTVAAAARGNLQLAGATAAEELAELDKLEHAQGWR